jgi:hypothetical protein
LKTPGELKLYGMKAAFDEIMATAVKRQHEPQRIVGDLLNVEISEKQARTHLAIAIARSCIRSGVRGRFYKVVDHNELAGGEFERELVVTMIEVRS